MIQPHAKTIRQGTFKRANGCQGRKGKSGIKHEDFARQLARRSNVAAIMRKDPELSTAQIARKLKVGVSTVERDVIWINARHAQEEKVFTMMNRTGMDVDQAAEALGINRYRTQTLYDAACERRVRDAVVDVNYQKAVVRDKLMFHWRESVAAWTRSVLEKKLLESKTVGDAANGSGPRKSVRKDEMSDHGNPRFLAQMLASIESLKKLDGLDEAEKIDHRHIMQHETIMAIVPVIASMSIELGFPLDEPTQQRWVSHLTRAVSMIGSTPLDAIREKPLPMPDFNAFGQSDKTGEGGE